MCVCMANYYYKSVGCFSKVLGVTVSISFSHSKKNIYIYSVFLQFLRFN